MKIIFSDKAKRIIGVCTVAMAHLIFAALFVSVGIMWEVMRSSPDPVVLPPYVSTQQIVEEVRKGIGCDLPVDEKNTLILKRTKNGMIIFNKRNK